MCIAAEKVKAIWLLDHGPVGDLVSGLSNNETFTERMREYDRLVQPYLFGQLLGSKTGRWSPRLWIEVNLGCKFLPYFNLISNTRKRSSGVLRFWGYFLVLMSFMVGVALLFWGAVQAQTKVLQSLNNAPPPPPLAVAPSQTR